MTLRELYEAAKAKRSSDWDRTADMMALTATIHSGKIYQRGHFHPHHETPVRGETIDPRAEYERIKRREARQAGK